MADYNKNPKFTGNEPGIELPPDVARKNARKYNCNRKDEEIRAHYFGEKLIKDILNQKGVVGFRIYYALNSDLNMEAFLVGVDADGNNVFKGNFATQGEKDALSTSSSGIYASSVPCPNWCGSGGTDFQ
jgi:hypothetical protein